MAVELQSEVLAYLKAGFPVLAVQTHEEDRAIEQIMEAAREIKRQVVTWTCTKGFQKKEADGKIRSLGSQPIDDPRSAIEFIGKTSGGGQDDTVYVLKDFHAWIEDPMVTRAVRDTIPVAKATGRTLCIVAPKIVIPIELEKDMTLITLDLPTTEHLGKIFDGIVDTIGTKQAAVENKDKMLEAGKGLSAFEAEQTYSFALVKHGDLSNKALKTVMREKAGVIKKTGIMEFYEPDADMSVIGGHDTLKNWLKKRARAFTPQAKTYGLEAPRGIILVGVQGAGKSLISKAIATEWMLPLLRLDIGRVFGSLVGQSEENMRKALAIAEAVAPCVLWCDEMEKGLSGLASSGQTDSGVTARVFGTFLTWMAERKAPVYVVATCNDISALPAEVIRKGRVDEIWFVDLPTQTERAAIFEIHIKKRGRDPKKFNIGKLAMLADQFSGAEIEEAIKSAMFDAFDEDKEVTTEHIVKAVETSPPLAQTAPEKIKKVREACDTNKWRRSTEIVERATTGRKIEA